MHFETYYSVEAVDRRIWNELAADAGPMMEWEYFRAMEKSGCVSPDKGYLPAHTVAYLDGKPVGLAPLYLRDRAWIEFGDGGLIEFLTELTGVPYRTGLVGATPFTPVPGYRFLTGRTADPSTIYDAMLDHIDFECESRNLLTSRFYFVASEDSFFLPLMEKYGYLRLRSEYRIWHNRGYKTFEDYLMSLKSSRRTKIRREVRELENRKIKIEMIMGREAPEEYYSEIHRLYEKTWAKHMGYGMKPFLNLSFFRYLAEGFRHRTAFSVSSLAGGTSAMALFYHKSKNLYGRYWGCYEEIPFLHFATCYYHPIDFAVRNGFEMMDPGFGGEHKMIRGYESVPVFHYIKFHGSRERRIALSVLERLRQGAGETE